MKSENYINPMGVLTPFAPLHFRLEEQEDVIKQIRTNKTQSVFIIVVFAK